MESIRTRVYRWLAAVIVAGSLLGALAPLQGQEAPAAALRPRHTEPITLSITGQSPRVLYETVGKLAGIDILWDSETQPQAQTGRFTVKAENASLRDVLDKVAAETKTSWKVLSATTIFVARR